MVITMLSLEATQLPFPVVVRVSVTVPAVFSAAEGVYTALSVVLEGTNDPEPPDQMAPVATVKPLPFKVTAALLAQTVLSIPALICGEGVNAIVTLSVDGEQIPLPVDVNVNTRLPERISPFVGVYMADKALADGLKEPAPPDHAPPVAGALTDPTSETALLLAQRL